MPACRILVDSPRDGAWNMAVDEVLLDRAAAEQRTQLRFYAWSVPTLSLGYFQSIADRASHRPSCECPLVRRASGGGAILHDREITYSLAVAGGSGKDSFALYHRVHLALVEMLSRFGVRATLVDFPGRAGHTGVGRSEVGAAPHLLCFQRRAIGDVLIGEDKVVGSAQRRSRGALLQHGSILLATSPAAPELPGINDLASLNLERAEWLSEIQSALVRTLNCSASQEPMTEQEALAVADLAAGKYGRCEWNARR
ncbi:MAG TPA: hypothetical protein VFI31_01075 [Pirellulales bacterium]|nr:hypothetical protein [Pirellulales bacterium]